MKTIYVAVIVAAILVAGGYFAVASYGAFRAPAQTITETVSAGIVCNASAGTIGMSYDGGLPLVVGNDRYWCERVFVIPPDSTGTFTVLYEANASLVTPRSAGGTPIANLTASVLVASYGQAPMFPSVPYTYVNATGITVTASPSSVDVSKLGMSNLTVTYTIRVSPGVRGSYELDYLDSCPYIIPLAIAQSASRINASTFPDYQPFNQGCTQLGMLQGGILLSVNGIQMAWIVQTVEPLGDTTG
jgi:hypothetical protein